MVLPNPRLPFGHGRRGSFVLRYVKTMDVGADARKRATATANTIVELSEAGRYLGDDPTLEMAHVCLAQQHMIQSAETRMGEAAQALASLQVRLNRAERDRDRVALEGLPCDWYWDSDDDGRARKVDSTDFCEPVIGLQVRSIGFIPARVQMAVNVRETRLAIKNGSVRTPDATPVEYCVVIHGNVIAEGPYLTLEEAVDVGYSSGEPYRAGPVCRPQAGAYLRLDDITESIQSAATDTDWRMQDEYVFQSREGASEVLAMAFDAAFESDRWRIAPGANRYAAKSRQPLPIRAV